MSNAVTEHEYEAFLTSVGNLMEAEILISLLESEKIPVRKKHNLTGDYLEVLSNYTPFGIDLFVPPEKLDQARALISAKAEIPEDEIFGGESVQREEEDREMKTVKRWSFRKKVMIAMIWIVILVPLAFHLFQYCFG